MINLDNILKSRDITLSTKVRVVKGMIFPVVMYCYESWTIKKADRWRTDAFKLWYWRRLLSPLDYEEIKPVNPKGNQSWIFIGRTDVEVETPIFWPPNEKNWLIGKTLMMAKIAGDGGDNRGWDGWMAWSTQWTWIWASYKSWWWTEKPGMPQSMTLQRVRLGWATEQQHLISKEKKCTCNNISA